MGGQKNTKNVGHHLCMFPNSVLAYLYLNCFMGMGIFVKAIFANGQAAD